MVTWTIEAGRFPEGVRSRGSSYYEEGRVEIERVLDGFVVAKVRGSREYQVRLEHRQGEVFDYSCSCPSHERSRGCKHAWATFRALEERPAAPPTRVIGGSPVRVPSSLIEARIRSIVPPHQTEVDWRTFLDRLHRLVEIDRPPRWPRTLTGESELLFWLASTQPYRVLSDPSVQVVERRRTKHGWGEPRPLDLKARPLAEIANGEDLRWLELLSPFIAPTNDGWSHRPNSGTPPMILPGTAGASVLRELALAGRLLPHDRTPENAATIRYESDPWHFSFALVPIGEGAARSGEPSRPGDAKFYTISAGFTRGDEHLAIDEPSLVTPAGQLILEDRIAPFTPTSDARWIRALGMFPPRIPADQLAEFSRTIIEQNPAAPFVLPPGIEVPLEQGVPRPRLVVRRESLAGRTGTGLVCQLTFDYGDGTALAPDDPAETLRIGNSVIVRDLVGERAHVARLLSSGASRAVLDDSLELVTVPVSRLGDLIETLLLEGWSVEAEGQLHRVASKFDIKVTTSIDWLDLSGHVEFGGESVPFPRLLGALRRGDRLIPLGDGSQGILPVDWLRRSGLLANFGELVGDEVRFRPSQAWVLDALLEQVPEVRADAQFAERRKRIRELDGIEPREECPSFDGILRPYQRDGLAWLAFLRETGLGGCLADDMGLGKTVQVIAHLEDLRAKGELERPVLVVAPRSVVEHWARETARFAPGLRVVDASGSDREARRCEIEGAHLVLITYAILRIDIRTLHQVRFDTVILDEVQAIKNARSQTAKAARLILADHRLAMSGTPIENHLGELWSLFEFLQPGMLGRASRFGALAAGDDGDGGERFGSGLELLAGAVWPFVLRRTKSQVAPDLPERTEATITCELDPNQRELYDELLEHYRAALLPEARTVGLGAMKMRVIEALLRLRQAACHPGLLDPNRRGESSGKLETIVERLEELRDEGHRCLVFSQFTKFLSIVRDRLDERGITYEYLDGRTRDRQRRIDRFQLEGKSTAFLISLKAGGLGLNLTAADYVFILDPWWNPASEAQAIDRAHRIGQTQHVFAYRLIAPGTVEEKITKLQEKKRALADAIIRADEGLVQSLTADDLKFILSR